MNEIKVKYKFDDASIESRRKLFGEKLPFIPKVIREEVAEVKKADINIERDYEENFILPSLPLCSPSRPLVPSRPLFMSLDSKSFLNRSNIKEIQILNRKRESQKICRASKDVIDAIIEAEEESDIHSWDISCEKKRPRSRRRRKRQRSTTHDDHGSNRQIG